MASSMCGPSNALSSLQKHTAADRSLQQDRHQPLVPSSQLFRTPATHTANQTLEGEFSQFSAGGAQSAHSHVHQHARADGWASDFQHLHIQAAPSLFQQQLHQQQQQQQQQQKQQQQRSQGWAAANWHEEFLQQPQHQHQHQHQHYAAAPSLGLYSAGSSFGQMGSGMYMGGLQQQAQQQDFVSEQFDDAAFERAFEDARVQLEAREVPMQEVKEEVKEKEKEQDSDELATTAAMLLDSVSGNHSRKFQDSTFLALMRRLRDREVKVEGDRMVEVGSQ